MERQVIVSGVGGQGIQVAGQLLGHAAGLDHKRAFYYSSMDGSQRGGASDCIVAIGTGALRAAPIIEQSISAAVLMHPNSLAKFVARIKPGGLLVYNSSKPPDAITALPLAGVAPASATARAGQSPVGQPRRDDVALLYIPADELAYKELGNPLVVTLIAVGGFLEASGLVPLDTAKEALYKAIRPARHKHVPLSQKALDLGAAWVREHGLSQGNKLTLFPVRMEPERLMV